MEKGGVHLNCDALGLEGSDGGAIELKAVNFHVLEKIGDLT